CVVSPLILTRVIAYYNKKSIEYLDKSHPVQRIGDSCDGYRPLYLAIQARTPVNWGFHEKLEKTLESAGLIIIDHRSWHTLGYEDGVDITEIFCQDKQVQVKIPGYFASEDGKHFTPSVRRSEFGKDGSSERVSTIQEESERETSDVGTFSISSDVELLIEERKAEIEDLITKMLGDNLEPADYAIQVSEWETFSFQKDPEQPDEERNGEDEGYCFFASQKNLDVEDGDEDEQFMADKDHPRAVSNASAVESIGDLWDTDAECHEIARDGYYQTPDTDCTQAVKVEEGCHLEQNTPRHRRTESNMTHRRNESNMTQGHHRNRSRAGSSASLVPFELGAELPSPDATGDIEAVAQDERQQETIETPPPAAHARRRQLHQRSHTMDVSMLDSYELESYTIKERLHGYVR
ncbi:MAG: hypothetical protein SGARI_002505, partial [Bacillariaceae sp.]